MGCSDNRIAGAPRGESGCERGNCSCERSLLNHRAVQEHGQGVRSEDLADYIMGLARLSASRVLKEGDREYNQGDRQAFEDKSTDQLRQEILEELADVVSYVSFIAIKVGAKA